jgi:D-threonate/D-erythronate kinase
VKLDLPALIADDFSGAMDSGVQFARWGFATRLVLQGSEDWPVIVLNTNSRELAADEAAERCRLAARSVPGRRLFKKIDSTLRGQVGAEIAALRDESGCVKAVVCPAAPLQGRIVRAGQIYVHGTLLQHSALRNDPGFPACTSNVLELLGRPTTHLSSAVVRRSPADLAEAILSASEAIVSLDGETPADLANIYQASIGQNFLLCGAFGLASAAAAYAAPTEPPAAILPPNLRGYAQRVLLISGSAHPATHAQLQRLAQHPGVSIHPLEIGLSQGEQAALLARLTWDDQRHILGFCPARDQPSSDPAWKQFSQLAGKIGSLALQRLRPDLLVIIGGETARYVCAACDVRAVDLLGEAAPGIPYGRLVGGAAPGLSLLTKSGGFGAADCLEKILMPFPRRKTGAGRTGDG